MRGLSFALIALVGLVSGCFVSVTGGGYMVETSKGYEPGYGLGFHIGAYLDFDPVRLAVGAGGDVAAASDEAVGVQKSTVEVAYSVVRKRWWRGRVTGAATFNNGYAGADDNGEEITICDGECAGQGYFLGGTFDIPLENGSISASLGPHVINIDAPGQDNLNAFGGQLRLTLSFVLTGAATIFKAWKYTPPERPLPRCEDRRRSDGTTEMHCE